MLCALRDFGGQAEALAVIGMLLDRLPPPGVVEVPADGLLHAAVERLGRAPAERALELGVVHRVAEIVARTVGDELDEVAIGAGLARAQAIEEIADAFHHLQV